MKFGWIPDVPDQRDFYFKAPSPAKPLPPKKSLSFDFVYDQGELGSCTAQSVATVYRFTEDEQDGSAPTPSRLALYYWTRKDQGTLGYDSGASIRGAMKAAAKYGMCRERLWPYSPERFKTKPSLTACGEAATNRMVSTAYGRVTHSRYGLKLSLYSGNPVVFGFSVYDSFMSDEVAKSGFVPMPGLGERVQGGHAVVLIGYDDTKEAFLVKNSWGKRWGEKGNCWMPYAFVCDRDYCDDFWTIYKVPALSK